MFPVADAAVAPPPVVSVHAPHPHAPSFAYTVDAWSDDGRGVIALAPDPAGAAEVVTGVGRLEPGRQRGDVVAIETSDGPMAIRLQRCHPASVAPYVLLRGSKGPARYLQAVPVADRKRSWEVDECECCPDLSRVGVVYRRPFSVDDGTTYAWEQRKDLRPNVSEAVEPLEVPVHVAGRDEGRRELLAAEPAGKGRVRLLQAPVIADWTSAGAVHELAEDGTVGRQLRPGLSQFGVAVSTPGHPVWDPAPAVVAAIERLTARDGVAVSFTGAWLAVAAVGRAAGPARSVVRRLVRDGHATEVGSYADPVDGDCCCVVCRGTLAVR